MGPFHGETCMEIITGELCFRSDGHGHPVIATVAIRTRVQSYKLLTGLTPVHGLNCADSGDSGRI